MPSQIDTSNSDLNQKPLNRGHALLGAVSLMLLMVWVAGGSGDHKIFIDVPSIILVLWVLIGGLWMGFGPRTIASAIGKALIGYRETDPLKLSTHIAVLTRARQLSWGAGVFGVLASAVIVCANLEDPAALLPAIAVSLLPLLYAAILGEFVFGPLQQVMLSRANPYSEMTPSSP